MNDSKVIMVMLRSPRLNDPSEMRSDPFWEFGSFGCTGCHNKNLMNPKKVDSLKGARFAFAQSGKQEIKLVYLSPPVDAKKLGKFAEIKWPPDTMPFKYSIAPMLINNNGQSCFPLLRDFVTKLNGRSLVCKFASKFRSSRTCLEPKLANEIVGIVEQLSTSRASGLTFHYDDALPYLPPKIDHNRRETYLEKLAKATTEG